MVRNHVWMQADAKAAETAKSYTKPTFKSSIVINEQILRVMQSLGIDPVRTAESVKNDSYDHHAAIYYLLQDKLSSSNSIPKTKMTQEKKQMSSDSPQTTIIEDIPEHQRRRPSTIAEQATLNCYKDLQGLRDYNSSASTAPHPTAFTQSNTIQQQPQIQQGHCWKTPGLADNAPPGSPASKMASGMMATDYNCLTCGLPILENTTSTTTCVKCARLRTRRRNFAQPQDGALLGPSTGVQHTPSLEEKVMPPVTPTTCGGPSVKVRNDSKDSGVSSGSSQDYDLSTPPIEKTLIFPRFPTPRTDRPSVPFSQLVRKLSEVEGITPNINIVGSNKTSLDEGVEVFESSDNNSRKLLQHQTVRSFEGQQSHSYGALAQKAFAATAPSSQTSSCFTSTESYPYESLDESSSITPAQTPVGAPHHILLHHHMSQHQPNLQHHAGHQDNNELTQSLPSCSLDPGAEMELTAVLDQSIQHSLMQQHQNYQMVMQQMQSQHHQTSGNMLSVTDATGQRQLMRSPISFREGRRASDGLVAQAGFVAFQQRLYDKGKAHGFIELHDVHLEHKALQHQFGGASTLGQQGSGSTNSSRSGTPDSALQQQSSLQDKKACCSSKDLRPSISKRISVPENFTYFPTSSNTDNIASKVGLVVNSSGLQQQLMQHRIYQKRQNMPKSALLSATTRRSLLTRQAGLKGTSLLKPYLPSNHQELYCTSASMCAGISNDFLFQPIAEDESDTASGDVSEVTVSKAASTTTSTSGGMNLLAVPTCMSMPSSPTPPRTYITPPPTSRTPPVILMEEDVEEVMSIDLTSAQATLTTATTNLSTEGNAYWQTLPSHMAVSCRLEASCPSAPGSPTRRLLQPPNKLDVTKVSPSSPNRSPILQTGSSCKVEPPPLKVEPIPEKTSPETMDISPK